jgi:hypothetical protein
MRVQLDRTRDSLLKWLTEVAAALTIARSNQTEFDVLCEGRGITGSRDAIKILRLCSGDPDLDDTRWADCVSYMAEWGDGDPDRSYQIAKDLGGMRATAEAFKLKDGEPGKVVQFRVKPATEALASSDPHTKTLGGRAYWVGTTGSEEWYTPAAVFEALGCRFDGQSGRGHRAVDTRRSPFHCQG